MLTNKKANTNLVVGDFNIMTSEIIQKNYYQCSLICTKKKKNLIKMFSIPTLADGRFPIIIDSQCICACGCEIYDLLLVHKFFFWQTNIPRGGALEDNCLYVLHHWSICFKWLTVGKNFEIVPAHCLESFERCPVHTNWKVNKILTTLLLIYEMLDKRVSSNADGFLW